MSEEVELVDVKGMVVDTGKKVVVVGIGVLSKRR